MSSCIVQVSTTDASLPDRIKDLAVKLDCSRGEVLIRSIELLEIVSKQEADSKPVSALDVLVRDFKLNKLCESDKIMLIIESLITHNVRITKLEAENEIV